MSATGGDFDIDALGHWLLDRVDGLTLPVRAERFSDGQSNPTYLVTDAAARRYVLRKKPSGELLPSAHAVDREYRVMKALADTDVPVRSSASTPSSTASKPNPPAAHQARRSPRS